MGFRSTFVTEDLYLAGGWPKWFLDKWSDSVNFAERDGRVISSKREGKLYYLYAELPGDISRVLLENSFDSNKKIVFVWLHECGGITRLEIYRDRILYSEPDSWRIVDEPTHSYCYGCSDVEEFLKPKGEDR